MKWFKRIFFFLITSSMISAAQLGVLKDIYKPRCFAVYNDKIYVTDQDSVLTFSLPELKQINKFVKKGQGPGEFTSTPLIRVSKKNLLVYQAMKFALFTPQGELVMEKNLPFFFDNIAFFGQQYFLSRMDYIYENRKLKTILSIGLYNKENKKIRNIANVDNTLKQYGKKTEVKLIQPLFKFIEYGELVYLVNNVTDFQIEVYNENGILVDVIKHDYKLLKLTDADKIQLQTDFLNIPQIKQKWGERVKSLFFYSIPDYYPAIKDLYISDNTIYVKTYQCNRDKEEYWVLSIQGKLLKKILLPKINERLSTFSQGKFYYLIENVNEDWECHCLKID